MAASVSCLSTLVDNAVNSCFRASCATKPARKNVIVDINENSTDNVENKLFFVNVKVSNGQDGYIVDIEDNGEGFLQPFETILRDKLSFAHLMHGLCDLSSYPLEINSTSARGAQIVNLSKLSAKELVCKSLCCTVRNSSTGVRYLITISDTLSSSEGNFKYFGKTKLMTMVLQLSPVVAA
jgi:hypothetical protein